MTLKIAAAGVGSRQIHQALQAYDAELVEAQMMSDLAAARAVQSGEMDLYLGACYSGQGGALAAAIGVLGYTNTVMVGLPGRPADPQKVAEGIANGVQAFGMTLDQIEKAVPMIVDLLLQKEGDL